jgi:tripartite-type tricarboxylate transporter receptor subunit TctC
MPKPCTRRFFSNQWLLGMSIVSALIGFSPDAPAADWPTKPVTLVVPFAAGGTTDIVSRLVARRLSEEFKQPVIVDNRSGAGGTLGAALVARASPDGYTIFMATIAHAVAPGIYAHLNYNFERDLDPVALVGVTPSVLVVNNGFAAKSVAELLAYARANPDKVRYGSAGIGSTEHIAGALFASMTQTRLQHIPYRGGSPMMTDLIGGQIEMAIETLPSAAPHVASGQVRALAVTSPKRIPTLANVPALAEGSVPQYEFATWYALAAPHGTPAAVVQRINAAVAAMAQDPAMVQRFSEQGVSQESMTPQQLGDFIPRETVQWTSLARTAQITAD